MSRLAEIKSNIEYNRFGSKIALTESEYNYLIQQAERVQELEKQNKRYREAIERALGESKWGDEGNALHRTIDILTKALEGEK